MPSLPHLLARHARSLGALAILICLGAWAMELSGLVGPCIYCQVQRTAIGLLGLFMLVPRPGWWPFYMASVIAFFGATTAATHHMNGWMTIQKGEFAGFMPLYANGFVLSGSALAIIVGQWMVLRGVNRVEEVRS